MRLPVQRTGGVLQFNLTPLIDVVFQLIIFFLCASYLVQHETYDRIRLPRARTGQVDDNASSKRLTVTILAGGVFRVGTETVTLDDVERLAVQAAGDNLEQRKRFELRIRSDESVPYRQLEPLLERLAKLGITRVRLAVAPGGN